MSVKDKIAMWNSMATNSNPPQPAPAKLVASDPPKYKPAQDTKPHPTETSTAPYLQTLPPVAPVFSFKKTESIDHPPEKTSPSSTHQNPKEVPKPVTQEKEKGGDGEVHAAKFSDLKKQLEAQTAGKGIYFAPATVPKKVEVVEEGRPVAECEIERDAPRASVKEQAAKLAQFFVQKQLEQLKKNQEQAEHHETQESHEGATEAKQEANSLNITPAALQPPEPKPEGDATLNLRVQKNKKTHQQFDDED